MLDLTPVVYTHLSLAPFFQYRLHYSKSLEHELWYNVYQLGFFWSCWKTLCRTHEHKRAPASLASKQTEENNQNRGVEQSKGCNDWCVLLYLSHLYYIQTVIFFWFHCSFLVADKEARSLPAANRREACWGRGFVVEISWLFWLLLLDCCRLLSQSCWVMIQILSPKRKADFWRSEAEARRQHGTVRVINTR
jgi:hypothetical protein